MKGHRLAPFVLAGLVVWAACGGDDSTGPAVVRNDPGTGTRTMKVTADIEGKDVPGGFMTDFTVSLRDAQGGAISGASVTIQNGTLGTVTLLEETAGSGDYSASRNTFAPGDYRLDVVKDTQSVRGVVVGGIAAHEITSPTANDTVPANQPLTVVWTRPSEAAGVDLETRDFSADGIADSGSFVVPAEFIRPRNDERIRVKRFNKVDIAGGLFGSRLKLSIRNTVEPIVVQ
jgi:hypothetical protein